MGKPLTKPVKIAISIYLAMVLLVCSSLFGIDSCG